MQSQVSAFDIGYGDSGRRLCSRILLGLGLSETIIGQRYSFVLQLCCFLQLQQATPDIWQKSERRENARKTSLNHWRLPSVSALLRRVADCGDGAAAMKKTRLKGPLKTSGTGTMHASSRQQAFARGRRGFGCRAAGSSRRAASLP